MACSHKHFTITNIKEQEKYDPSNAMSIMAIVLIVNALKKKKKKNSKTGTGICFKCGSQFQMKSSGGNNWIIV